MAHESIFSRVVYKCGSSLRLAYHGIYSDDTIRGATRTTEADWGGFLC